MNQMINSNPREVMAAAGHAVALRLGAAVSNPHPLASELSLPQIAYAAGALAREPQRHESHHQIMNRGMRTGEFSRVLAEGVRHLVTRTYETQAQHIKFCDVLVAIDFRNVDIPGLDVDTALNPLGPNAEVQHGIAYVVPGATQVGLTTYAKALLISREVIINDQHGMIEKIITSLSATSARIEAAMVANTLEGNQNFDDGNPAFHVDYNNIVASAFSDLSLGTAMAALRTQTMPDGSLADLAAAHLVVAPDLERQARSEIFNTGLPIEVSALANLPTGRWYLLADKTVQPTVGVLRLKDAKVPVRVEQKRAAFEDDGAAFLTTVDLGTTLLSRIGIVRGGV